MNTGKFQRLTRVRYWLVVFILLWLQLLSGLVVAQQLVGTYTTSAPEASLFFLNPGYLNPALGKGILGMAANPAALRTVTGRQMGIAFELPQSSDGSFSIKAMDSTDVYAPVYLDTQLELREMGGIAAVGYAQQMGRWCFGVGLMQAQRGGVNLQARGGVVVRTHFEVDQPITKAMVPDLPVDEIPILWNVNTDVSLEFASTPAQLYLSILPIMAGVCYNRGPLSLGLGVKYFHISSSDETARLTSLISGIGTIVGVPYGNDPYTGTPWRGSVTADFTIDDQPFLADYSFNVSGNRFEVSVGGILKLGPFSIGANFANGFRGNIKGSYQITTIQTIGLPEENEIPQVDLNWSNHPQLSGHASLYLANFKKDTTSFQDSGELEVGGYRSYSFGIHFLVLGAFVGGELPQSYPDLASVYAGINIEFPLPFVPVRLNAGLIHRTDAIQSSADYAVPFRVVTHAGIGVAVKFPYLQRWTGLGKQDVWLRFGLRSSLTSLVLKAMEEDVNDNTTNRSLPSVSESLALSLGLEVPF